jgi:hypothetical protein
MIESIMYFGIGFLFAALIGVAVIPSIHARAVRLTMRRLENSIPQSMAEIQADKDLLRAEFALSTRRLEIGVEQLKEQTTSQLAELGRKGDVINRLKIEREAQNVETHALKTKVESLKEQLVSIGKEIKVAEFQRHEPDVVSLVPKDWPRAEPEKMPTNFAALNEQSADNDVVSLALERPRTEEARSSGPPRAPDAERDPSEQRVATTQEASRISTVLRAEPPIHISADDQIAREKPVFGGRTSRNLRRAFIVALLGVGATFTWRSYSDEAKQMIGTWGEPLSRLLSASTEKSPPAPASAAAMHSAEMAQQLEALTRDLADVRIDAEKFTAKQEQTSHNISTPKSGEQDNKQKLSSTAPESQPNLTPFPDTKPTTIAGWALLEVIDGTAVVQGPNGVWRVTRGDTVPGVGRVDSIVRWGNRWIVATSRGLISTP